MRLICARYPIRLRWRQILRPVATVLAIALAGNSIALAKPPDSTKLFNKLTEHGIGNSVRVKETDGSNVTGKLVAIRNNSFDVTPVGATQLVTISYSQVAALQTTHKLSTGAKVGIVVGCVVAVVVVTLVIVAKHADIGGLGKGPII